MNRKQNSLAPLGDAITDLPDPVQALLGLSTRSGPLLII